MSINSPTRQKARIQRGKIADNRRLCRDHFLITILVPTFPAAQPGQFVHLRPPGQDATPPRVWEWRGQLPKAQSPNVVGAGPFLRRAFSIADLRRASGGFELDLIHRVVGKFTHWMMKLNEGDELDVFGPLGNTLKAHPEKPHAYLVAGGVGLPPMLWLARILDSAGVRPVLFFGAGRREFIPLDLDPEVSIPVDPTRAIQLARNVRTPIVLSTDDGSIGYKGFVTEALHRYHEHAGIASGDVAVYACGPEPMMRAVADFCLERSITCQLCMERKMACGMGTCQSCVLPVRDESAEDGWRYSLCCTEGCVYDAAIINWEQIR